MERWKYGWNLMASLTRKPKSKFWIACFTLPGGKRTQRSTKTTDKRLAQRLADEFELPSRKRVTEMQARRVVLDIHRMILGSDADTESVRSFFTRWLESKRRNVTASSMRGYKAAAAEFLESLGERADADLLFLTRRDILAYRDKVAGNLATATANKKLKILRVALGEAWRDGLIEENPAAKVSTIKDKTESVRRPFTLDEIGRILAMADNEWQGLTLMGLYTGQRLGDLARLTWKQLDLDQGLISFVTQKTRRVQILPITPSLREWIDRQTDRSSEVFPGAFANLTPAGHVGTLSNQFQRILSDAGLVPKREHARDKESKGRSAKRVPSALTFHCLRHTATSLMKNAGVSPAIVQEFIGHESKIISDNYTHIDTEALRSAADKMPSIGLPTLPLPAKDQKSKP